MVSTILDSSDLLKKSEKDKEFVQSAVRARLPDAALPWIDAAFAILNDGSAKYNPLLGTGGNEGRLDLTNNFMQRLVELLVRGNPGFSQGIFVISSLFDTIASGMQKSKIGQFDPGRAGGYNQGAEIETKDFKINPWDFVLMLEGSVLLTSSIYRRGRYKGRRMGGDSFCRFS